MTSPHGQDYTQSQWYNSPTMQALHNSQSYAPQQNQWEEKQYDDSNMRRLVEAEHRKQTPVLDYTVGIVSPDDQSVTAQNYRSRQLLYPEPKAKHYYPVGNYMSKPSYLLPTPEPKAAFDTMYQTNVPAPPSVLKPSHRRGMQNYEPALRQYSSPKNVGYQTNGHFSSSKPVWVNGPANQSNANAQAPSISRMVQWPPSAQQFQENTGNFVKPQQNWQQGGSNNPSNLYEIEVANPDNSSRVVHMQYNSPMGMYSAQNVADSLVSQTGLNPSVRKVDNRQTPTYQAVMSDIHGGGTNL